MCSISLINFFLVRPQIEFEPSLQATTDQRYLFIYVIGYLNSVNVYVTR